MRWTPLVFAALVVLPGCILSPGQDDLSYVCETKANAPGPAYTTDGLVAYTRVDDPNLTAEHARKLLDAVTPAIITEARHAHAAFHATLAPADAGWRFEGVGRAANGTVLDTYTFVLTEDAHAITVEPLTPSLETYPVPETLVSRAWALVNASPDLAGIPTRTPTLVATGWSKDIPSCVHLLFQQGPNDAILPASPEHPHTKVVVSLASDRVVFFKRDGWE